MITLSLHGAMWARDLNFGGPRQLLVCEISLLCATTGSERTQ